MRHQDPLQSPSEFKASLSYVLMDLGMSDSARFLWGSFFFFCSRQEGFLCATAPGSLGTHSVETPLPGLFDFVYKNLPLLI